MLKARKMAHYDFDEVRNRRGTDSIKWQKYGDDILPLWVADMDFPSADPIRQALHERVEHGVYGYACPPSELYDLIQERLRRLYRWEVKKEDILLIPTLVAGLNLSFQVYVEPGDAVLAQPPIYHHFIKDPVLHGRTIVDPPLVHKGDRYEIDFAAFEKAITERTRLFALCNPHNPVGRAYTAHEVGKLAEICLRHGLTITSDEIHCDLLYPGYQHTPIASVSREVAEHTVTLMAPSKTFNLPGLGVSFVIIQNPTLREMWKKTCLGLMPPVNFMGQVAAVAAYKYGQEWLDQVLDYLLGNRDFLSQFVREKLPGVRMTQMEATYLAWLDCRGAGIPGDLFEFFLKKAKVALFNGKEFGKEGEGFVRLNFACPRKTLTEALEQMAQALKTL
jgi:cysteine-S-conjugate beta-lyase